MFACPIRAYLLYSTFLLTSNTLNPGCSKPYPSEGRPLRHSTHRPAPRLADSLRRPAPDPRRKEQQRAELRISFTDGVTADLPNRPPLVCTAHSKGASFSRKSSRMRSYNRSHN